MLCRLSQRAGPGAVYFLLWVMLVSRELQAGVGVLLTPAVQHRGAAARRGDAQRGHPLVTIGAK